MRMTSRMGPELPTIPSWTSPPSFTRSAFSSSRLRSKSCFRSAALATARATSSTSSKGLVR